MGKYIVEVPVDYVAGHIRYGHLEYNVEANSEEEAIEIAKQSGNGHLVVDDYEVDGYGEKDWSEAEGWLSDED